VNEGSVRLKSKDGDELEVPCGLVVWAAVSLVHCIIDIGANMPDSPVGQHCAEDYA